MFNLKVLLMLAAFAIVLTAYTLPPGKEPAKASSVLDVSSVAVPSPIETPKLTSTTDKVLSTPETRVQPQMSPPASKYAKPTPYYSGSGRYQYNTNNRRWWHK